ncbi:flagellar hook-associated protein FlgK [Sapientia aquatica]|uniref:Flagellar hook-associated protein 1 n=1 Tax=Sapientia aquatica TaxID=1549640 RepID=A0A4R5W7B5_9BURK|nr:flagellar hook-associated protein FlgK [Sapientia aquatica]TDK68324.1 flagellar hook-associated protein FlgK [Sapientia aquatica]
MSVNIFEIGTTGLQSAEVGIATTGQNISNANTAGYSSEVAQQATAPEAGYSFGYVGMGTQVNTITRNYDSLLAKQINQTQSTASQLTNYSSLITPIDNMIADPSAGLSPVLQSFFSSLQNLSSNPSGVASLQTALSGAQTLANQFQAIQGKLNQSAETVNSGITSEVNSINNYAQQLASVNQAIQVAYANANNQPPNALLDQRDTLVANLSKETQVTVVPQGNQYNVFIGTGQPLVLGFNSNPLTTTQSAANPNNLEVAFSVAGKAVPIGESSLPGGNLGGLFAFRTNSLVPIQNAIGQVGIVLASSINAQNELGQTIKGAMGGPIFNVGTPQILANAGNTGGAALSATITNPSALTADNYSLTYDGTNYTITDTSTNTVKSTFAAFPATPTNGVNVIDGVTYTLASGTPNAGDTFTIAPTANGATAFTVAATDATQIACAAPVATNVPSTNTGTGKITPGSVSTGFVQSSLATPITLNYTAATNSVGGFPTGSTVVVTNGGVPTTYTNYTPGTTVIPYQSGMSISFNSINVGLSGSPADGDTFNITANTNGVGDNRNILLMNALQTANTMSSGTATFQGAYAALVDTVGNTTSQLTTTGNTETNLLKQATTQQQSGSGVNLDHETVNLLQYQQVYQACGKLIQIANANFTTILDLNR